VHGVVVVEAELVTVAADVLIKPHPHGRVVAGDWSPSKRMAFYHVGRPIGAVLLALDDIFHHWSRGRLAWRHRRVPA
jgi:hypothetical protein